MMVVRRVGWRVGRRSVWLAPLVGVITISAGCLSLEQMAPSVGPEFTTASRERSIAMATLEQGRNVYLTDCTRCHSAEPISRYSAPQWGDIVGRMATESKLDESHTAALRAYVLAAHDVLARRAAAKEGRKVRITAAQRRTN